MCVTLVTLVVRRLQRASRMSANGVRKKTGREQEQPASSQMKPEMKMEEGKRVPVVEERPEPIPRSLISRMAHWGPLLALGVISEISMATIHCHLEWWHPREGLPAALNLGLFMIFAFGVVSNLFDAATIGPRYVPFGWRPEADEDCARLQFCEVCRAYKAPRSHHCRKCNRCCCKMDHHCPWINNCVGFANQPAFMKFLAFAVIGCFHSLFILGPAIYRGIFKRWHEYYGVSPVVDLGVYGLLAAILGFGLAVGVTLSVGFLLYVQLASVYRNKTGIEDYILRKAAAIRKRKGTVFHYPYAIGWRRSFADTFTWSGRPRGDGIWWPIAEGATQFTLSEEQMFQKKVKRRNAVEYEALKEFSGRCLTCKHGCKTFACTPWTDEPRLLLHPNYRILVTRWAKCWLYGELLSNTPSAALATHKGPLRGWFPEGAVRCLQEMESDSEAEVEENSKSK